MKLSRRFAIMGALSLILNACNKTQAKADANEDYMAVAPLKEVASFPVGTCVMTGELQDEGFTRLLNHHFSQITPEWEMQMQRIIGDDGQYDFSAADAIADYCRRQNMKLHATSLVWYAQDPKYFRSLGHDRAAFAKAYKAYIQAVTSRYRGVARGWDVLNEAIAEDGHGYRGGIWQQFLGDDYARLAFEHAKEADPEAVLFLNDYNLELMPEKLDTFQRFLEKLLKSGAPVEGIGTQSHLNSAIKPGQASKAIKELSRFGLPIHVSELDVSTRSGLVHRLIHNTNDVLKQQASIVQELAQAFMDLPSSQRYAFTMWGLRDKDSWLRRPPNDGDGSDRPLLFDDNGNAKPAYFTAHSTFASGQ